MKQWNLVLKDFLEDSITKMWTMSCWTLTASHYFRFFSIYYMDTIHITSWKKASTILSFLSLSTLQMNSTQKKGGLDGWWPTLGLCSSLSTDQWLQWCHRCLGTSEPADWPTDSTDLGLSHPSLGQGGRPFFWGVGEVKGESWRLGGGK